MYDFIVGICFTRAWLGGTGLGVAGGRRWSLKLPRELSGKTPRGGYSFNWVLLSLPLLRDVKMEAREEEGVGGGGEGVK